MYPHSKQPFLIRSVALGAFASMLVPTGSIDGQQAEQAALRGTVESDEARPVVGAMVSLRRFERTFETVSDTSGGFRFGPLASGTYLLDVRRVGYDPAMMTVALSGRDTVLRIRLKAVPAALDTVRVTATGAAPARYGPSSRMAEFYSRKQRGRGRFFTREHIDNSGTHDFSSLLRQVPGVRVAVSTDGLKVTMARCSTPTSLGNVGIPNMRQQAPALDEPPPQVVLFVDGVRVVPQSIHEALGSIRLENIEALEVYRGPSELPAEAVGNACAAIYVWSRFGASSSDTVQRSTNPPPYRGIGKGA